MPQLPRRDFNERNVISKKYFAVIRLVRRIKELGLDELQKLFATGKPAKPSGQTEGILVTWTMHPLADRVIGGSLAPSALDRPTEPA